MRKCVPNSSRSPVLKIDKMRLYVRWSTFGTVEPCQVTATVQLGAVVSFYTCFERDIIHVGWFCLWAYHRLHNNISHCCAYLYTIYCIFFSGKDFGKSCDHWKKYRPIYFINFLKVKGGDIIDYIYLPSFLILLDEHLKIPNSAKMEVRGVKSSKQFSDLDLMPKTSINTNTTISNQSIVSIYDSSTRDDLPMSIKLSQRDANKNEKKTMVKLIVAWNCYQLVLRIQLWYNTQYFFSNFSC